MAVPHWIRIVVASCRYVAHLTCLDIIFLVRFLHAVTAMTAGRGVIESTIPGFEQLMDGCYRPPIYWMHHLRLLLMLCVVCSHNATNPGSGFPAVVRVWVEVTVAAAMVIVLVRQCGSS